MSLEFFLGFPNNVSKFLGARGSARPKQYEKAFLLPFAVNPSIESHIRRTLFKLVTSAGFLASFTELKKNLSDFLFLFHHMAKTKLLYIKFNQWYLVCKILKCCQIWVLQKLRWYLLNLLKWVNVFYTSYIKIFIKCFFDSENQIFAERTFFSSLIALSFFPAKSKIC